MVRLLRWTLAVKSVARAALRQNLRVAVIKSFKHQKKSATMATPSMRTDAVTCALGIVRVITTVRAKRALVVAVR